MSYVWGWRSDYLVCTNRRPSAGWRLRRPPGLNLGRNEARPGRISGWTTATFEARATPHYIRSGFSFLVLKLLSTGATRDHQVFNASQKKCVKFAVYFLSLTSRTHGISRRRARCCLAVGFTGSLVKVGHAGTVGYLTLGG